MTQVPWQIVSHQVTCAGAFWLKAIVVTQRLEPVNI